MQLRARIAVGVLAAVFAAAPSLVAAASGCGGCCPGPEMAHGGHGEHANPGGHGGSCERMLAADSCCDQAPAVVPSVAKRALEAPSFTAAGPLRPVAAAPGRARAPERRGDLARLVSPLRFSVVLRI